MRRNNVIMQPSAMPFTTQQPEYVQDLSQIFAEQNARNQQANAVNAKLDQQQRRGSDLTQLDELIAIQDRYKARKNAEMQTPMYKEDQAKALAQALLGTKQVESMSYGGNPVKQSPDGRYWLENDQEVTDIANIQTNNTFDPIAGALNATKQGNVLGADVLTKLMQPKQGMDLADKMALQQQDFLLKKELLDAKPKKDTDLKPKQIDDLLKALRLDELPDDERAIVASELNSASSEDRDELGKIFATNTYRPTFGKAIGQGLTGAVSGAGAGALVGGGLPGAIIGGIAGLGTGLYSPYMYGTHLNKTDLDKAMLAFKSNRNK